MTTQAHLHTQLMSHKPDDPEDDEAGEHAGDAVAAGHHDAVPEHVVGEVVVAGQSHHPAPSHAQWEEDLDTRVRPNLERSSSEFEVCGGHRDKCIWLCKKFF